MLDTIYSAMISFCCVRCTTDSDNYINTRKQINNLGARHDEYPELKARLVSWRNRQGWIPTTESPKNGCNL